MERVMCEKCIMDKSAPEITFNEEGICNFCIQAEQSLKDVEKEKHKLSYFVEEIKKSKGKYNCLIGLSGGLDSSYLLHKAVEMGLKPLCFSVDNGWQNPLADENIMKLVEGMQVPYYRYPIDLKEFRDLQSAFIQAGQKNIEIPTDHILFATTYEMAEKYGIKWILSGGNVATESIMPASWGYNARDLVHLKDVYKKMKGKKIKHSPTLSLLKWNWLKWAKNIRILYLLDYTGYDRGEALKILGEKYDYKPYHEKHCESMFTWWFQNWYLFEKFGIDKRKAHLSSLIASGQMTRSEALEELAHCPVYPDIGFTDRQMHQILKYPKRPYTDFKTDEKLFNFISKVIKLFTWN